MKLSLFGVNVFLSGLIGTITLLGDFIVAHSNLHLFQAVFDNATHAIVAGLSWFHYRHNYRSSLATNTIIETAICTIIASLIDVDHFISARSFHLKDATSLRTRPFLHCTTYPVLISGLLLIVAYVQQYKTLKTVGLLILTAFLSHHTRDATRRGYWLHPFGSTPPIPYYIYVFLTCLIPYLICALHRILNVENQVYSRLPTNV